MPLSLDRKIFHPLLPRASIPKRESHGSSSEPGAADPASPAHLAGPGGAPGTPGSGASHIGSSQPIEAHPPAPVGLDKTAHDDPPKAPAKEEKPSPEQRVNYAHTMDTPDTTSRPFRDLYIVDYEKDVAPIAHGPGDPYRAVGLDPNEKYRERALYSNPEAHRLDRAVHVIACSSKEKAINVVSSYKLKDILPEEDRLEWSELTVQGWREEVGDRVHELKWIVRQHVVNEKTQKEMAASHKRVKIAELDHGVFNPGAAADSPMDSSWTELTKTPNAKGVFHMLADHHREFRNLKVIKIHTWLEFKGQWGSMILELGH